MEFFLQVWYGLIPVALVLIVIRDDFHLIAKDVKTALRSGIWGALTLIIIITALPITIPYSILNIINR